MCGFALRGGIRVRYIKTGGASRDRTGDPLLAKQVLSQLSYGPEEMTSAASRSSDASREVRPGMAGALEAFRGWTRVKQLVGLGGLEPPASPLSGVRSNHLSYRPV